MTTLFSTQRFTLQKSTNVIYYTNKLMERNDMIIFIDEEKAFDKIQNDFMKEIL